MWNAEIGEGMGEGHVTGGEGGVVVELMELAVSESIKQWKYIVNGTRKIWATLTSTTAHIVKSMHCCQAFKN